jgi:hypothetical protein
VVAIVRWQNTSSNKLIVAEGFVRTSTGAVVDEYGPGGTARIYWEAIYLAPGFELWTKALAGDGSALEGDADGTGTAAEGGESEAGVHDAGERAEPAGRERTATGGHRSSSAFAHDAPRGSAAARTSSPSRIVTHIDPTASVGGWSSATRTVYPIERSPSPTSAPRLASRVTVPGS